MLPQARVRDASTPLACAAAEAGLFRSVSFTLFGFFTSNSPLHAATASTSPARSSLIAECVAMVSLLCPAPGSEAEPDGEREPPGESQSERIDALAEVRVDPAQVEAGVGRAAA